MSKDLELLLNKKEKELQPLLLRMEELRLQFINETTVFAAKWYEKTAKDYVTKNHKITLSIGDEKLSKMKAKVRELSKNADKIVAAALSDSNIWWHQKPRLHDYISQYEQLVDKFPEILDKPVRRALGELGIILEQFGYDVSTGINSKTHFGEYWYECAAGPGSSLHPYFPHILLWSEEMQNTIRTYNKLFREAIIIFSEMKKLQDKKKNLQAGDLWDST